MHASIILPRTTKILQKNSTFNIDQYVFSVGEKI